jgi:hypothetical protein
MKVITNHAGFRAEWTPEDRKKDLPRRFERALVIVGEDFEETITALMSEWASQVEAGDTKKPRRPGPHRPA